MRIMQEKRREYERGRKFVATEGKEGEKEESKGKQEARTQDGPGKALRLELGKEEPGQAFVRWRWLGLAQGTPYYLVCSGIDYVLNQTVGLTINTSQLPRPTRSVCLRL